jgi:TMEM175 potassium channel family protein
MTTDFHANRRGRDLLSVERLVGLSDNVVAFALTLLVLQVTVPPLSQVADPTSAADLALQLHKQAPHLASYAIAFYIIAQFWLVHRRVFRHVAGHRDSLAWWNFAFLATITVMPFTSNLLGEYGSNPLAVDIFAANLLLAVLATRVMFEVGRHVGLMARDIDAREVRALRARTAAVVVVVALSAGLAWVNPTAAKYCWLLIPAVQWTAEHRSARPASPNGPPGTPGQ